MKAEAFVCLEDVVLNAHFPDVDLALRRGRHIDSEDLDWFTFLLDAQVHLESFYRRFDCELIRVNEGYFYLLPSGRKLGKSHLTNGEMLVGQALALLRMDAATTESTGRVHVEQLFELLSHLVDQEELFRALSTSRRKLSKDQRVAQKNARDGVHRALNGLEKFGFVDQLGGEQLRLRAPLTRFAEPVRELSDPKAALAQLIARGAISVDLDDESTNEDDAEEEKEEAFVPHLEAKEMS